MGAEFFELGEPLALDDLGPEGRRYLAALQANPHMEFVEARRTEKGDLLVFEACVGVPARPKVGVRKRERLAVEVRSGERPSVLVLRRDFPVTPHQNITAAGSPRSLCLSERSWSEDRSSVTPQHLLQQVTDWLERAARGRLHLPGQPLEPFLFTWKDVIVDRDVLDATEGEAILVQGGADGRALTIKRVKEGEKPGPFKWLAMPVETTPTDTLVVRDLPSDFGAVVAMLRPFGIDLVRKVQDWTKQFALNERRDLCDAEWVFLIRIPRIPVAGADLEEEMLALLLRSVSVGELGVALNVLDKQDGKLGYVVQAWPPAPHTLDVGTTVPLNPVMTMTRAQARRMSGLEPAVEQPKKLAMVGLGALGSQVAVTLARQGIGSWTYIDPDLMMPHNLARHALYGFSVGYPKATSTAMFAQSVLDEQTSFLGSKEDVLNVTPESESGKALVDAEVIFDFTTSRAALRFLSDYPSDAVRLAGYITASRRHLVLLSEGAGREVPLADLDVLFSTACASEPALASVQVPENVSLVRYAGGCGNASTVLAEDVIATLAGIAVGKVKQLLAEPQAGIWVWELISDGPTVSVHEVPVAAVDAVDVIEWQVRLSRAALSKMYQWRRERLPNETGGVLVGAFDVDRRVLYVSDALPSPPDSEEWPTSYVRGSKGLYTVVKDIETRSGSEVGYVGEWHSHPGSSPSPSRDDQKALDDLSAAMAAEGLPGLVTIIADGHMAIELKVS